MLTPVILFFELLLLLVVRLKVVLECFELAKRGVEPVLDVVVYAPRHQFLYLDPFVTVLLVQLHEL